MSYLRELTDYYASYNDKDIPEEVIKKTKITLFDFLCVLVNGNHNTPLVDSIRKYVMKRKASGDSEILGFGCSCDAEIAALAMGMVAHGVELDDGHRYGTAHPSVAVIPAVLSLGEERGASYEEMLKAIAVGYDMMLRMARAINPSHLKRGFHTTGTCGTLGAAAGAAMLLRFDSDAMAHAISISALQSAGLQEMLHGNPSIKVLQAGRAAQAGLLSCRLVEEGAKGPATVFEGIHGWLKAMTDSFDENDLIGDLDGSRWEIMNTYTKLYPTCRHCHAAIDLAVGLYDRGIRLKDVSNLKLTTYHLGIVEVGVNKRPENIEETMFSVTYSIAVALKFGRVRLEEMRDSLTDDEILAFSSNVIVEESEEMNKKYPEERGAKIDVNMNDGRTISVQATLPKGEYDTPLTDIEYQNKAKNILDGYCDPHTVDELWDAVVSLNRTSYGEIKQIIYKMMDNVNR